MPITYCRRKYEEYQNWQSLRNYEVYATNSNFRVPPSLLLQVTHFFASPYPLIWGGALFFLPRFRSKYGSSGLDEEDPPKTGMAQRGGRGRSQCELGRFSGRRNSYVWGIEARLFY